jgi:hypothetical protein
LLYLAPDGYVANREDWRLIRMFSSELARDRLAPLPVPIQKTDVRTLQTQLIDNRATDPSCPTGNNSNF